MSRGAKRKPAAMKVDLTEEHKAARRQKAARLQKAALLKKTMKIKSMQKVKVQIKKLIPDAIHQVILYIITFNII